MYQIPPRGSRLHRDIHLDIRLFEFFILVFFLNFINAPNLVAHSRVDQCII